MPTREAPDPSVRSRPPLAEIDRPWRVPRGIFLIFGLVGLAFFYRQMVFSGFTQTPGDLGDARHMNLILEHWFRALLGEVSWRSPNFFFPQPGTLGYSEALFLWVLPYAGLRLVGVSVYSAFQGVLILLTALGYTAMYLLLRRGLSCDRLVATLVAGLFAFSNQFTTHMGHPHLLSMAFVPALAYFGVAYLNPRTPSRSALLHGLAASALLAMLLYTCFNVAWFVILFVAIFAMNLLGLTLLRGDRPSMALPGAARLRRHGILLGVVFAVCSVPFLLIYAPVWRDLGGRTFAAAAPYLPSPRDLIYVGDSNLVWGWLGATTALSDGTLPRARADVTPLGTPLLLMSCFLYFAGRDVRATLRTRNESDGPAWILSGLAAAVVVSWLLIITVNGHSLWRFVFVLVPGATAIRVVNRYQLVLYVAMCVVVAVGLSRSAAARPASRWTPVLRLALAPLLLAEQANYMPTFDKVAEATRLARTHSPPSACRSFFADNRPSRGRPFYAFHTDAGLVARLTGIPTLNGYSSNVPRGWDLVFHDSPRYASAVADWVASHSLWDGLCSLDLERGEWRQVERRSGVSVRGVDLVRGPVGSLDDTLAWVQEVSTTGFHPAEPAGRWTNGHAVIRFARPVPSERLSLTIASYNPQRARLRIAIDGVLAAGMAVDPGTHSHDIDTSAPVSRIELVSDTFVPKRIGLNADDRTLGIYVISMVLR